MSKEILQREQEKIDAEILVLQERIRTLRSSRNTLSFVYRLPPEVVTQIFKWTQLHYRGNLDTDAYTVAASFPK
ncbi:hypothetical protein BDN72DRAFT_850962, partial [Pluteus cervinus]